MILVTGGQGQVARALGTAAPTSVQVVGRPVFDFAKPDSVRTTLDRLQPRLVINAAAYTAVDRAESEPDAAFRANRDGPEAIARWCAAAGAGMIHVSTDYVFDGRKDAPYTEADSTNPTGIYGASKLAGELAVLAQLPSAVILRTAWVYAPWGQNFVHTMLNAATRTNSLRVVADQIGCPTAATELAQVALAIADRIMAGTTAGGVFHATGTGFTSWHGLAMMVFQEAARHGRPTPNVQAISTQDWLTSAQRPANSRLDCTRLADVFAIQMPPWQDSVRQTVSAILAQQPANPG